MFLLGIVTSPFAAIIGFLLGMLAMWAFTKWWLEEERTTTTSASISLGNIECIDNGGGTTLRVPFTITPPSAEPVELRIATYNSNVSTKPDYDQADPVGSTTSPIDIDYDPMSCHDTVVVYAAFASDAEGDIPCVDSSCSSGDPGSGSSGSDDSRIASKSSVLP